MQLGVCIYEACCIFQKKKEIMNQVKSYKVMFKC